MRSTFPHCCSQSTTKPPPFIWLTSGRLTLLLINWLEPQCRCMLVEVILIYGRSWIWLSLRLHWLPIFALFTQYDGHPCGQRSGLCSDDLDPGWYGGVLEGVGPAGSLSSSFSALQMNGWATGVKKNTVCPLWPPQMVLRGKLGPESAVSASSSQWSCS